MSCSCHYVLPGQSGQTKQEDPDFIQGQGHSAYRPGVPVVFRAEQRPSAVLQGSSFYKNCTFLKVQRSGFPLRSNAEPIPSPPGSAAIEQDLPFDRPPLLRLRMHTKDNCKHLKIVRKHSPKEAPQSLDVQASHHSMAVLRNPVAPSGVKIFNYHFKKCDTDHLNEARQHTNHEMMIPTRISVG